MYIVHTHCTVVSDVKTVGHPRRSCASVRKNVLHIHTYMYIQTSCRTTVTSRRQCLVSVLVLAVSHECMANVCSSQSTAAACTAVRFLSDISKCTSAVTSLLNALSIVIYRTFLIPASLLATALTATVPTVPVVGEG